MGFTPVRSIAVTLPEPLKAAVSLKPQVPGAAWTPEPLLSVQLLLAAQELLPPVQEPLPEKTWAT